jgi:hypothetical protein
VRITIFPSLWSAKANVDGYHVLAMETPDHFEVDSLDELPPWLQERCAVLRLLDEDTDTPLGAWATVPAAKNVETGEVYPARLNFYVVRKPGDPHWVNMERKRP